MQTVPDNTAPAAEHPHADLIAGLRELADWYEQHPDVPAPRYPQILQPVDGDDQTAPQEVARIGAALGVPVKRENHIVAERSFGPVGLRVYHVPRRRMDRYHAEQAHVDALTDEQLGLAPEVVDGDVVQEQAALPTAAAGCDGCGKVGSIAPHGPGCTVAESWDRHRNGDHSQCADGGSQCAGSDVR